MDNREGESNDSSNTRVRKIFAEFMTGVTRLEQLAAIGGKFLSRFQYSLDLIRRPQTNDASELVKSVIKENDNKRIRAYIEGGWAKTHDRVSHMCEMNKCFEGLHDHLSKAKEIMCELECLMSNAGSAVQISCKSSSDMIEDEDEDEDEEKNGFESEIEIDATEYASFMAIIYSMVEKDYLMQEKVVSALNLSTYTEELDSYCLMWSLRPFVDDDVLSQAFGYKDLSNGSVGSGSSQLAGFG